ncbi:MAG: ribonuclease III [Candidatus Adiutrix intracellularis]|jgi:ribonuclease-3|nr:ribonuclease III [Candidatus Adiutrix intracellularis]
MVTQLKYHFKNSELLIAALTHRSAGGACEKTAGEVDNQRLEFLGDAVLDLIISDFLFRRRPRLKEGDMSRVRAGLVREVRLAEVARRLNLGEALILGPGEVSGGGRWKNSMLADAVEALFGAIYLDGGLAAAEAAAGRLWEPYLSRPEAWMDMLADFKSRLQEETQGRGLGTPNYELVSTEGPDHARRFTMAISINGQRLTEAKAGTKKEAEQKAARLAIDILKNDQLTAELFK